jgi:hypothetical protein
MTAFVACRGRRPLLSPTVGLAAVLIAFALPESVFAADPVPETALRAPVIVPLDQAKLLKLPERTATLVIGNPLIADATVQNGGVVVITAKSYGTTNMVILDRAGATLSEMSIQVVGPEAVIVVYKGVERETYSCLSACERRITLGDSVPYFNANLNSFNVFSKIAGGGDKKE